MTVPDTGGGSAASERSDARRDAAATLDAIGRKIRALRKRLLLTLDETAALAGISKPFLSQIERGLARPSVATLLGIARALGVSLQYFLDVPRDARFVLRGKEMKYFAFADTGNLFARLTRVVDDGLMEALLVRIPAGREFAEVVTLAGEQFWYVLSGNPTLTLNGKKFVFRPGDATHHDSTDPHGWENTGDVEAVLMWVGTPSLL
ncbi:helix-turn-helix domain-containing protein [Trinickia terrae]|uniref:Helix-turn-helix domain-containing protein n=1 Tax=Trinickia terrae TaxID=2571161 RepID=A0A4U1I595_9BURK|nr:XRE family transcriptional regulator [Trinickia terrae]TKC88476.1 helix-turn-helix domain-containing protein [Trinickia terrae]